MSRATVTSRATRETLLTQGTLRALLAKGVFAWRANSGVVRAVSSNGRSRKINLSPAGTPDILLVIPGSRGQLGGIELKSPRGWLRDSQIRWMNRAEKLGVRFGVARSIGEALAHVAVWQTEARGA